MFKNSDLQSLFIHTQKLGRLQQAAAIASWDQETNMPAAGAASRALVLGELAEIAHMRATSDTYLKMLEKAEAASEAEGEQAVALCRELRRSYNRVSKVPAALAVEIAETASLTQIAWAQARKNNSFADYLPHLSKMLELKIREAECIGGAGSLYETMLDEYEPGTNASIIQGYVDEIKPCLVDLVKKYSAKSKEVIDRLEGQVYSIEKQKELSLHVLSHLGFDQERGRVDLSTHPFCMGINANDVRLTTRYQETDLESLYSLIHETGHGLYEQGLDPAWEGTPLGQAVSLGIHESQSRLWENNIGRSKQFWDCFRPKANELFPDAFASLSDEQFLIFFNQVRPSLIRVDADETTYNLHIMLRFELEQEMVAGDIDLKDLPDAWNDKMESYLGLRPKSDAEGVLQDVHWSFGAFGYFPTYFLGNLYGAQIMTDAYETIEKLDAQIAEGQFDSLRQYLVQKIHKYGAHYSPSDLCKEATGSELQSDHLANYLRDKLSSVYGF